MRAGIAGTEVFEVPDQPVTKQMMGNLTLRIISAAVLAPIVLLAVWTGGLIFSALVILVAVLGFWEWTEMSGPQKPEWTRFAMAGAIAAGLLSVHFCQWDLAAIFLLTPIAGALIVGTMLEPQKWAGMGMVYVVLPAAGLMLVRSDPATGLAAVIFIMLVVWATDIVAYFGGRAIGGPKLWPRVSPKKTWSGGLCGLAAAFAVGLAMSIYLSGDARVGDIAVAGVLSVFSQAGDFLESAVKRRFGAKDSGTLIPGHGGVLDRVDGLFGAAAVAPLLAITGVGSILPVLKIF